MGGVFSRRDFANRRLQRKRDNVFKKTGVATMGLVVFFVLIAVLLRIDALQFNQISIEGERHVSEAEIQRVVEQELNRSLAFVLPRSNVLLFSSKSTKQQLLDQFPRIAELEVRRDMFARTVSVELTERSLWMVLCNHEENDCVSVSRDGIAYAQSPTFSGNLVTKVIDERNIEVELGKEILTKDIRDIVLLYTEEESVVAEIGKPQFILSGSNEMKILSLEGWYVIADFTSDPNEAYANMVAVLREEIGEDRLNLEYIDTRFGNRIFYKTK